MPSATMRVCIEPGCHALSDRTRCRAHERTSPRNHRGIPRQQRGLGAQYDRQRRAMRGQPCELRLPGCTGVATGPDHVIPRSQGGASGPVRPACLHCNASRKAG